MVTIREVAKAAGVSVATASRALNGLSIVTAETRAKIEAAAAELNYVPHSGARSLTRRKTDAIGVILPDLFGEFFSEMIRGIDMAVHGAGKHLLLGNMHGSTEETVLAIKSMRGRVDGLLVMPPNSRAELLGDAATWQIPTVLLNAQPQNGDIPFVSVDNYSGARMVTEHLIDQGARKIVHISGPASNRDASERMLGYRDVLHERLSDTHPIILPGNFREDAGRNAAQLLLNRDFEFDAVFAANDMMAVDLMAELTLRGSARWARCTGGRVRRYSTGALHIAPADNRAFGYHPPGIVRRNDAVASAERGSTGRGCRDNHFPHTRRSCVHHRRISLARCECEVAGYNGLCRFM